jgi:hypothetical protein
MLARLINQVLIALALPAYVIRHIGLYANTYPTWPGKIATFIVFLPVIGWLTLMWFGGWVFVLWPLLYFLHVVA